MRLFERLFGSKRPQFPAQPPQSYPNQPFTTQYSQSNPPPEAELMKLSHWRFYFADGSQLLASHFRGGCRFLGTNYMFYDRNGQLVLDVPCNDNLKFVVDESAQNDPQKSYTPPIQISPRARRAK